MRKFLTCLLVLCMLGSLVACAGTDAAPSEGAPASTPQQSAPAPTANDALANAPIKTDPSQIVIGLSMKTVGAPYFAAQEAAIKAECDKLGITLYTTVADGDMGKQMADVEDMIAKGVDALIINAQDPEGIIPVCENAVSKGVPVFLIDTTVSEAANYVTLVQSNNQNIGFLVGEWVANNVSGEIRIGFLSGNEGNMVGQGRRGGFIQGLTEGQLQKNNSTNFRVLTQSYNGGWSTENGLTAAEDMLVAAPDINLIFAENDSMGLGAIQAIKNIGKEGQIKVVGIDGQKEALALINEGTNYLASGLNDPAECGLMGLQYALRWLGGERDLPRVVNTTPACVNPSNISQYFKPDAVF